MSHALELILERSRDDEDKAITALNKAMLDKENYQVQLKQIEQYRFDYSKQLSERGLQGLTASEYNHLQKFLGQLDETLAKQRSAGAYFEHQIELCVAGLNDVRKQRRSVEWLINKRSEERLQRMARQEQQQMDEFATLLYSRRITTR